jgi:hypothetical protein
MIYTCYDMVRDCRSDRAEGWRYFLLQYVPVIRRILAHYFPSSPSDSLIERVLVALRQPQSSLFASLEPAPERWFVAELRQQVLTTAEAGGAVTTPPAGLEIENLTAALEKLTLVEKQAVWLETMRYSPEETGTLLRMDPHTVEKIRGQAAERIRGHVDTWSRSALWDSGRSLGRAAAASQLPECLPAKAFLDVLDGRASWRGREQMEQHVMGCWHCIDYFCRLLEVLELVRGIEPLPRSEAERFRKLLHVEAAKPSTWKRLFGWAQ